MDGTLAILKSIIGSFPTAMVLLVAVTVFVTWKVSKFVFKTKSRIAKLESSPCKAHSEEISKHSSRIGETNEKLSSLDAKMDLILRLMPQFSPSRHGDILSTDKPPLSEKHSPRVLNDNGRKIDKAFGCAAFISSNRDWLVGEVDRFAPKTALDVEMYSLTALRIASVDCRFNAIKDAIYHSPSMELKISEGKIKDVEISLEDVLFVMSILLRDVYLKLRPNICDIS